MGSSWIEPSVIKVVLIPEAASTNTAFTAGCDTCAVWEDVTDGRGAAFASSAALGLAWRTLDAVACPLAEAAPLAGAAVRGLAWRTLDTVTCLSAGAVPLAG